MTELFTVCKTAPITGLSTTGYGEPTITMPNKCMTYNRETGQPLGVVGMDYHIMQPQECYDLVEKTCGSVDQVRWDGKTMIMQGQMNSMLLPGDDQVDNLFTIINSFDGSSAVHGLGISFRMTCANQLSMAFRMAKATGLKHSIRHNGDWDEKVRGFRLAFEGVRVERLSFKESVTTLVQRNVSSEDIEGLWKRVAPRVLKLTKADLEKETTQLKMKSFIENCTQVYQGERDGGCPDSMWLAANAVTKTIQHKNGKRGRKADADRRYVNNAIGIRANDSSYVMRTALELV